jgi:hypothetical protein
VISTHLLGVDYLFCGPDTGSIRAKFNGLISEEKKADNATPPDTGYAGVYVHHKGAPEWPPEELNISVVEEEEKSLISAFAVADIVFIVADAKVSLDSLLTVARAASGVSNTSLACFTLFRIVSTAAVQTKGFGLRLLIWI